MLKRLVLAVLIVAMTGGTSPVIALFLTSDTLDTLRDSATEMSLDDDQLDLAPVDLTGLAIEASDIAPRPVGGIGRPAGEAAAREEPPTQNNIAPTDDPLASMLRSLLNTTDGSDGENGPAADAPSRSDTAVAQGGAGLRPRDLELEARVKLLKEAIVSMVEEALSPQVDGRGRVTFSMLGVDGFHVDKTNETVSIGFRDSGFQPVITTALSHNPWAVSGSGERRPTIQVEEERLTLYRLAFLVWDIVSHPATIGIVCLILFIRLIIALMRIRQVH